MSEQNNLHDVDLLTYWKSHQWRFQFNATQLTQSELPRHQIISATQLDNLELSSDISEFSENEEIWLALKLRDSSDANKILLPLWLPAQIKQGKIVLRTDAALPWIPGVYFSPHSKIYFKHAACYEDFLRFECLENKTYRFADFISLQQNCLKLLDTLFENKWQIAIESLGLVNTEQWLVFKSSDLVPDDLTENAILKNYSQFENIAAKDEINTNNFFDYAHLIQAQRENSEMLSAEALQIVLSILSLKSGDLQAIKAPIGTDTKTIIQEIMINQFSAKALGKKEQPIMAIYSPNKAASSALSSFDEVNPFLDKEIFISYCQKILANPDISNVEQIIQMAHEKMMSLYEDNLHAVSLMRTYLKVQKENHERYHGVETFLEKLETEDEKTEIERHKYLDIYAQWQSLQKSHNILQKCFSVMPLVKKYRQKKAGKFLNKILENEPVNILYEQQLVEYIRSLKVKQAKNDQKRIKAVGFLNELRSARASWKKWLAQHHGGSQCSEHIDMTTLLQLLAPIQKKLWQLCSLYWQAQNIKNNKNKPRLNSASHNKSQWYLQALDPFNRQAEINGNQELDYLFIDAAHLLSPMDILPILSRAKRVIFWGDNTASIAQSLLSKVEDEFVFKAKYNMLEEDLECLQASGHLLSSANAFQVAQNNSEFQNISPCGLYRNSYLSLNTIQSKNKALFQYWNEQHCHNQLKLTQPLSVNGPSISLVPILGKMHLGMNVAEIEKIVSFIQNDLNSNSQVAIIAPFYHQQKLLSRLLQSNGVTIHTFENLPQAPVDFVIFSPVYTSDMPRPYIFDEGAAYFYRLLGLAKKSIWILGDSRIFDEQTHSPSGQIAKLLKNQVIQTKQVEPV